VRIGTVLIGSLLIGACAASNRPVVPTRAPAPVRARRAAPETVIVTLRDTALERRAWHLDLRAIEQETQITELQARLDSAREEVVKTMSRLQTLSSRAEAASGLAEAEVLLGTLRSRLGAPHPVVVDVAKLVEQSSAAFNKENYGGAFFLATQAKAQADAADARLGGGQDAPRAGETTFAVPIRVKVTSRGNVREGAGTSFAVSFEVESGALLTAIAYLEDWVRVMDDGRRTGWIHRTLVGRP